MVLAVAEHCLEWHRWRAHAHEWSWQWLFPRGALTSGRSLNGGMAARGGFTDSAGSQGMLISGAGGQNLVMNGIGGGRMLMMVLAW